MDNDLLHKLRSGGMLPLSEQITLIVRLSVPAILAQLSSIIMSYIDAAMVGQLGADRAASIGLVASSTWLVAGMCFAASTGFTVQAAQLVGARKEREARSLVRLALAATIAFSAAVTALCAAVSAFVPVWLGGAPAIQGDARMYFLVFSLSLPVIQLNSLAAGLLQCSGEMKVPSALQILMAVLNVALNYLLIFVLGLGVFGAALATLLARLIVTVCLMAFLLCRSPLRRLRGERVTPLRGAASRAYLANAVRIGIPVAFEQLIMSGGQVAFTRIVSPLGTVPLAANSFAITAESLCYMPAYGLGAAATTLTGQSFGAGRTDVAHRLGWLTTALGMALMVVTGGLLFAFAPQMIGFLSPDAGIRRLGARVLRIESFAEPLYGASLVANGALRGTGDTFVPSCFKFFTMWLIRIPLALALRTRFSLEGVWFAMCAELCLRGILFLVRLKGTRWLAHGNAGAQNL